MKIQMMDPQLIRTDRDTQSRLGLSEQTIADYCEAMERDEEFPPVLVYFDEQLNEYILADGFHRHTAHVRVRPSELISAEVRLGTAEDARWASLMSNNAHGLQRTLGDKKKAVREAIVHPNSREMSAQEIARHVGVSRQYVTTIRRNMQENGELTLNPGAIEKAKAALTERRNMDLSNRQLADKIGVNEITIRRARQSLDENRSERSPLQGVTLSKTRRNRDRGLIASRRLKKATQVTLPQENPGVFAVELRNNFDTEYLIQCFIALKKLWSEQEDLDS